MLLRSKYSNKILIPIFSTNGYLGWYGFVKSWPYGWNNSLASSQNRRSITFIYNAARNQILFSSITHHCIFFSPTPRNGSKPVHLYHLISVVLYNCSKVFKFWIQAGIIISGLVTASVHSPWILISLEALGSGAVFYVSCFEMLPEAFQGDWKILKCIFTIIGVLIIAILQIFHSDEHDGHWNAMTIQRYFHETVQ